MTQSSDSPSEAAGSRSRVDLWSGMVWICLGLGIAYGSWKMDRLPHLQASVYSLPGLVPGVLGLSIALMGLILVLRAQWSTASLSSAPAPVGGDEPEQPAEPWRLWISLCWSLLFAVVVVKSAAPFWLLTAIYVAVFVIVFQLEERRAAGTIPRGVAVAVVHGLITGFVIQFVFEKIFLVRLP